MTTATQPSWWQRLTGRAEPTAEPDFTQESVPANVRLARLEAELEQGYARQRELRLKRSAAARKGHETRKRRAG